MKGTFRIGGAAVCGVLLILGAFLLRDGGTGENRDFVVSAAPERTAINPGDTNENGIEDWEEHFTIFETIAVPTSSAAVADVGPYEEPTTLTGRFSEAFVQDYLQGKIGGMDFSDPTAFAEHAASAVQASIRLPRHTRLEVPEVETTPLSMKAYGNHIAEVMEKYSTRNENEALILARALEAEDQSMLESLIPIQKAYEDMAVYGMLVPVPSVLVDEHLALVNAFETLAIDISAMRTAFTDPLKALTRVAEYREKDAQALYDALVGIAEELRKADIRYEKNERGASFYLFEKQ